MATPASSNLIRQSAACIWRGLTGSLVPMPTLPPFSTQKASPPLVSMVTLEVPVEFDLIRCWNPVSFQEVPVPQSSVPTIKYARS